MILFPKATEDLLVIIAENRDDPAPAIDKYLQKFSINCAQSFMTSLTRTPGLFTDQELLDRMCQEQEQ